MEITNNFFWFYKWYWKTICLEPRTGHSFQTRFLESVYVEAVRKLALQSASQLVEFSIYKVKSADVGFHIILFQIINKYI